MVVQRVKTMTWLFLFQLICQTVDSQPTLFSCDPWGEDPPNGYTGPNGIKKKDHYDCINDGPLNCPPDVPCEIYCEEDIPNISPPPEPNATNSLGVEQDACANVTINCPTSADCFIDCIYSCHGMTVNAETSTFLEIYNCGIEQNGCNDMTIYCPQYTGANSASVCNISGNNSSPHTINGLNIYSQQSFFDVSLDLPLIGNNNIMHCGATGTEYSCIIDNTTASNCDNFVGRCQDYIFTQPPTKVPTIATFDPTNIPTTSPIQNPTNNPTKNPTFPPSTTIPPTISPTKNPSTTPTTNPSFHPSQSPTIEPTTNAPTPSTSTPTIPPTLSPTSPTKTPTINPTKMPSKNPTDSPTLQPTFDPSKNPTFDPTISPTSQPTISPTSVPTMDPVIITTDPAEEKVLINDANRLIITITGVIIICILGLVICFSCFYFWNKYQTYKSDEEVVHIKHTGVQLSSASPPSTPHVHNKNLSQQRLNVTPNILSTNAYPTTFISLAVAPDREYGDDEPDLPPERERDLPLEAPDLPPSMPASKHVQVVEENFNFQVRKNTNVRREGDDEAALIQGHDTNAGDSEDAGDDARSDDDDDAVIVTTKGDKITPNADKLFEEQQMAVLKHNHGRDEDRSQSDEIYLDPKGSIVRIEPKAIDMAKIVLNENINNNKKEKEKGNGKLLMDDAVNVIDIIGRVNQNNNVNVQLELQQKCYVCEHCDVEMLSELGQRGDDGYWYCFECWSSF